MKKAPYGTATPGAQFKPTKIIGKDVIIISENFENVKSNNKKVLEGSAESIAMRQKEARMRKSEELMDDMKEDFPQLKNIYEILKRKG